MNTVTMHSLVWVILTIAGVLGQNDPCEYSNCPLNSACFVSLAGDAHCECLNGLIWTITFDGQGVCRSSDGQTCISYGGYCNPPMVMVGAPSCDPGNIVTDLYTCAGVGDVCCIPDTGPADNCVTYGGICESMCAPGSTQSTSYSCSVGVCCVAFFPSTCTTPGGGYCQTVGMGCGMGATVSMDYTCAAGEECCVQTAVTPTCVTLGNGICRGASQNCPGGKSISTARTCGVIGQKCCVPDLIVPGGCGGNYFGGTGAITSPDWPQQYPNNANCTWSITADSGYAVSLFFVAFHTEGGYDTLTVIDGGSSTEYDGINDGVSITSVTNQLILTFISDFTQFRPGFNIDYCGNCVPVGPIVGPVDPYNLIGGSGVITSPGWPGNYPDNEDVTWTITADDGFVVTLFFASFHTEANYDDLTVTDGEIVTVYHGVNNGVNIISETNQLTLHFTSDFMVTRPGFELEWCGDCAPLGGPVDVDECATGVANCDVEAFCTNTVGSFTCTCNTGYTGDGFTCTDPYNLIGGSGVITSPNWPSNYLNFEDVTWTITADPGFAVTLNFLSFHTEHNYDDLTVTDSGVHSTPYSGVHDGVSITSVTNQLTLHFTSDFMVTRPGFEINWCGNCVMMGGGPGDALDAACTAIMGTCTAIGACPIGTLVVADATLCAGVAGLPDCCVMAGSPSCEQLGGMCMPPGTCMHMLIVPGMVGCAPGFECCLIDI